MNKLPPKRSNPLTAHEAFDRICDLRQGREERRKTALAGFDAIEAEAEEAIAQRIPEEQRPRLDVMLRALPLAQKDADELVRGRRPDDEKLRDFAATIRGVQADAEMATGAARSCVMETLKELGRLAHQLDAIAATVSSAAAE